MDRYAVSFFEGDYVDRGLKRLLGEAHRYNFILLLAAAFSITWLPTFLLSLLDLRLYPEPSVGFLQDYSAIAQYLVGIPLFLLAIKPINYEWIKIQETIYNSAILETEQERNFQRYLQKLRNISTSPWTFLILAGASYAMAVSGLLPSLSNLMGNSTTWYMREVTGQSGAALTYAGIYGWFVAIPLFNFTVMYWALKYLIWILFMWKLSRTDLKIIAYHPDRSGGLHFLSQGTLGFALLIFALGIIVVTTVLYKVKFEGLNINDLSVYMMVIGYSLLAPVVFLIPLLFFTQKLYTARVDGIMDLNRIGYFLHKNRSSLYEEAIDFEVFNNYSSVGDLTAAYEVVKGMRIWPIDLVSIGRLFGSAILPMLPILLQYIRLPEPLQNALEIFVSV